MKITRKALRKVIKEELLRIHEGEVVNLFSGDREKQNAVLSIARALANRTAEMLNNTLKKGLSDKDIDLDIERERPDYIDMNIDPELFLTPYADIDGDGRLVRPLAQEVYEDYVSGKAGDQAESLVGILGRIEVDYFDEMIQYALEALGDDRFTMPHTYYDDDDDQKMKTRELASQQDPDDVDAMEAEIEAKMQGIESGEVVELDPDDYDDLSEAVMVSLQPITQDSSAVTTQEDMWMRIAGIQVEKSEKGED